MFIINKERISVRHTSTNIYNYELGSQPMLENKLSVWDNIYYTNTTYYTYDEDNKVLKIPRGININMLEVMFNTRAGVDYEHDEFAKASFKLRTMPRDNIQKKSICFLIGDGEFKHTKNHSQVSLNLTTGDGKTYCCIAAMTSLSMTSIIITHIERIKTQWYDSLKKFTTLDDTMICNIDSSKKIDDLLSRENKYKVYLVNHRTIYAYAKKHGWESIGLLFIKLKIGLKIYDEAHLEFANILKIDQYTNIKKNIYLTANFEKSNPKENFVFNNAFGNVIKFGVETLVGKTRHIVYMPYLFNSRPSPTDKLKIKNKKGFDRNVYSDYQMTKNNMFSICDELIGRFTIKNDTKIMVLFSKIDAVELYFKHIKNMYPDLRIGMIHSKVSDVNRSDIDLDRIILSTPKSVGTGAHIDDLGCIIMTEPYSSPVTANQVSGRLRYLGDSKDSYYIELVDSGFETVQKMYTSRLKVFKKKCKKILILRGETNNEQT